MKSRGLLAFLEKMNYRKKNCLINVPGWIWTNSYFISSFISGLFDTDGCLALKKDHGTHLFYPVIKIFSKDRSLLMKIASWIKERDIHYSLTDDSYFDLRTNKTYQKYNLQISGYKNT